MTRDNRKHGARNAFEVGSSPPQGYIAKQEWAEAQMAGGLKQTRCRRCGLWLFPQELEGHNDLQGLPCTDRPPA